MHQNITPRRFYPLSLPKRPELGELLITADARARIPAWEVSVAIAKHARGDHGFIERGNEESADIRSLHESEAGQRFFIVTEPDGKTTTVFLDEEW